MVPKDRPAPSSKFPIFSNISPIYHQEKYIPVHMRLCVDHWHVDNVETRLFDVVMEVFPGFVKHNVTVNCMRWLKYGQQSKTSDHSFNMILTNFNNLKIHCLQRKTENLQRDL